MRTASGIEANKADKTAPKAAPRGKRTNPNPNWRKNLVAPWKPGQSGNPGGRPKNDVAQQIAMAVFTQNPDLIYRAFAAALKKGNAYAFQVLSDRAFGKVKDRTELTGAEGGPIEQEITVRFVRPE